MKIRAVPLLSIVAVLQAGPVLAQEGKVQVVTTLPYLADITRQVGGDLVDVQALAQPGQDPHFVQATPALSVKVADAELYFETGMQLELWSERVIDGARNARIRVGAPGHVYTNAGITPRDVPVDQSRASGDVHPGGNPHYWLDPVNLKAVARTIEAALSRVRPAQATTFQQNREAFEGRLDEAFYGPELLQIIGAAALDRLQRTGRLRSFIHERQFQGKPLEEKAGGWLRRAIALGDLPLVTYHSEWVYFAASFGLRIVGTLEAKPGIPPTPGHLEELQRTAQATNAKIVECSAYYPMSRAEAFAEQIGGVAVLLPTQPGELEGATDVIAMFDQIFTRLEEAKARVGQ
jgi:zinc/manganese transport system substrate-binding protein